MTNMSYCRFRNTVSDMADCVDNLDSEIPKTLRAELDARVRFIKMCRDVAGSYEDVENLEEYLVENQLPDKES